MAEYDIDNDVERMSVEEQQSEMRKLTQTSKNAARQSAVHCAQSRRIRQLRNTIREMNISDIPIENIEHSCREVMNESAQALAMILNERANTTTFSLETDVLDEHDTCVAKASITISIADVRGDDDQRVMTRYIRVAQNETGVIAIARAYETPKGDNAQAEVQRILEYGRRTDDSSEEEETSVDTNVPQVENDAINAEINNNGPEEITNVSENVEVTRIDTQIEPVPSGIPETSIIEATEERKSPSPNQGKQSEASRKDDSASTSDEQRRETPVISKKRQKSTSITKRRKKDSEYKLRGRAAMETPKVMMKRIPQILIQRASAQKAVQQMKSQARDTSSESDVDVDDLNIKRKVPSHSILARRMQPADKILAAAVNAVPESRDATEQATLIKADGAKGTRGAAEGAANKNMDNTFTIPADTQVMDMDIMTDDEEQPMQESQSFPDD